MSGRTLHLRDGVLITNRKTDRRQSEPRPALDRLHALNVKSIGRYPPKWCPEVRIAFLLPKSLRGFISSGVHGYGVKVTRDFVQIVGGSSEQCFKLAQDFLAIIAKHRPAFTLTVSIVNCEHPDRNYGRHLTVVRGAVVVSGGVVEPKVFEERTTTMTEYPNRRRHTKEKPAPAPTPATAPEPQVDPAPAPAPQDHPIPIWGPDETKQPF
jgi:hypothetical protein